MPISIAEKTIKVYAIDASCIVTENGGGGWTWCLQLRRRMVCLKVNKILMINRKGRSTRVVVDNMLK